VLVCITVEEVDETGDLELLGLREQGEGTQVKQQIHQRQQQDLAKTHFREPISVPPQSS